MLPSWVCTLFLLPPFLASFGPFHLLFCLALPPLLPVCLLFVALGNHEFDWGPDILKERIKDSNFVWLGSNVFEDVQGKHVLLQGLCNVKIYTYAVSEEESVTVGLFGLCTQATPQLSFPGPSITFEDPIKVAAQAVKYLRQVLGSVYPIC